MGKIEGSREEESGVQLAEVDQAPDHATEGGAQEGGQSLIETRLFPVLNCVTLAQREEKALGEDGHVRNANEAC